MCFKLNKSCLIFLHTILDITGLGWGINHFYVYSSYKYEQSKDIYRFCFYDFHKMELVGCVQQQFVCYSSLNLQPSIVQPKESFFLPHSLTAIY